MRIRKPLFVVFTLLYVIILPFLISYALGYDLLAIARGRFVRTGGVFVASTPPRARLTIDGKEQSRRTPLSVISLPTGVHAARLELEGFRPWVRSVRVKAGEVTIVDDALLIPQKWQRSFVDKAAFVDMYPEPIGSFLLLRRGNRLRDLWLYDVRADALAKSIIVSPVSLNAAVRAVHTVAGSSWFLVEVSAGGLRRVLRGRLQWPSLRFTDVTRLFPGPLTDPQWSPQDPDTVYVTRQGRLYRVKVAARTARPYEARLVSGFTLEGRNIYAINQHSGTWRIDTADGQWQAVHSFDPVIDELGDGAGMTLTVPVTDLLIARTAGGELAVAWPEASFRASGVRGFDAPAPYTRVLAWERSWLAVATLLPPADEGASKAGGAQQASTAEERPVLPTVRTEWIPSRGGAVTQAWFVYGGTHVLYHAGHQVTLHAPSHDGQDFSYGVADAREGTSAWFSGETGRLYYIDSDTGRFAWTQVVTQPQPLIDLIQEIRDLTGGSGQ